MVRILNKNNLRVHEWMLHFAKKTKSTNYVVAYNALGNG